MIPQTHPLEWKGDPDKRPLRWVVPPHESDTGDLTVVYSASSLGSCERAFIASALNEYRSPMPEWFREVLDEGTVCEGVIIEEWDAKTGSKTINDQKLLVLELGEIRGKRTVVIGHIDGESEREPDLLREIKKFRPSTWDTFLREGPNIHKNYPWQLSVYMHAGGYRACEMIGGRVSGYRKTVVDSSAGDDANHLSEKPDALRTIPVIGEVQHKLITEPLISLKEIRKRVVKIERLIGSGFTPDETDCDKSLYPCPYFRIHDEEQPLELPTDNKRLKQIVEMIAAADKRMTALRAEMKPHEESRKTLVKELKATLDEMGPEVANAKLLSLGTQVFTRSKSRVDAKPYDTDVIKFRKAK